MNLLGNCSGIHLANGLKWFNEPTTWNCSEAGLYVEPDGGTDVFRKYRQPAKDTACFLYTEAEGDFTLMAKIKLDGTAFGDAGAITIRRDDRMWAKLCVERSPAGETSIVSVVTNEWSDDANNELLETPEACLRITRLGNLIGMHHRAAGGPWRFVRVFGLEWPSVVRVGVQAQAPVKPGCKVYCKELILSKDVVRDFRSGE
jgi:uncharacterized protein